MEQRLLKNKNILITGAGRNIGKSIALEVAREGGNVYFTDIDPAGVENLKSELSTYSVACEGFVSDISKFGDIDQLCKILADQEISIDVLINNVGVGSVIGRITDFEIDEYQRVFGTNFFGPLHLTKMISQRMIDRHIEGSIVFITSIHQWTVRRFPAYSSSKAALGMMIKELAVDLAPYGIRVNGIAPGYVEEDKDHKPFPHKYTPLHQTSINPCYVGRAAIYLVSEWFSKFTTGTILKIDAGLSLYNHLMDEIPLEK